MRKVRRWLPDSLGGQLTLAMLASIILLFIVNIYAVCLMQVKFLGKMEKERSDNIAAFYLLLSEMGQEMRRDVLSKMTDFRHATKRSLAFALMPGPPGWQGAQPQAKQAVGILEKQLATNNIPAIPEIHARTLRRHDSLGSDPWSAVARDSAGPQNFPLLQMAIRLDDTNWLSITQPLYTNEPKLVWMQRLVFILEFAAFGILVLFLLHKLIRPFLQMSQAAERVGKNPEVALPLPEEGCKEIREAAQSFNRMQARIRENLAERDRMLAAMAHDLRTPLTRAQLRIEAVEPEELREKLLDNLGEVRSIAEQSLELSRSLKISEKLVPVDIVAFMQSRVDDHAEMGFPVSFRERGEDITPAAVLTRPLCLQRCVDNLLRNAVMYGGKAEVDISLSGSEVTIDICDNGPGIPEQYLERIFEPYFRLEGSRNRESGGTGLGLSIARNMILRNSGTLTLENRAEGGLRARIVLPRLKRA